MNNLVASFASERFVRPVTLKETEKEAYITDGKIHIEKLR
jgi:hypothetical protein